MHWCPDNLGALFGQPSGLNAKWRTPFTSKTYPSLTLSEEFKNSHMPLPAKCHVTLVKITGSTSFLLRFLECLFPNEASQYFKPLANGICSSWIFWPLPPKHYIKLITSCKLDLPPAAGPGVISTCTHRASEPCLSSLLPLPLWMDIG